MITLSLSLILTLILILILILISAFALGSTTVVLAYMPAYWFGRESLGAANWIYIHSLGLICRCGRSHHGRHYLDGIDWRRNASPHAAAAALVSPPLSCSVVDRPPQTNLLSRPQLPLLC